jgi:hypothetical protein
VIADYQWNLAMQFTGLLAVQGVGQAMQVLRYENGDSRDLRHHLKLPLHLQVGRDGFEFGAEGAEIEPIQPPLHAHEEEPAFVILVLVGVRDVRSVSVEEPRNAG